MTENSKPSPKGEIRGGLRSPWAWVPSLYFAEGIPYLMVMTIAAIMYKRLGLNNDEIALYTSWLYLPWVIKPLWSPIVDMFKSKRWWIVVMEFVVGVTIAGVALTIRAPQFVQYTMAFFWLMAFSSATHDIAADGFYIIGLNSNQQSLFVGIRSTFYRISMIAGQGLTLILAGTLEKNLADEPEYAEVKAELKRKLQAQMERVNDGFEHTSYYERNWVKDRCIIRTATEEY